MMRICCLLFLFMYAATGFAQLNIKVSYDYSLVSAGQYNELLEAYNDQIINCSSALLKAFKPLGQMQGLGIGVRWQWHENHGIETVWSRYSDTRESREQPEGQGVLERKLFLSNHSFHLTYQALFGSMGWALA